MQFHDFSQKMVEFIHFALPQLTRQDSRMTKCISPEKTEILATGLHRLGQGSSYVAIGANFSVGRSPGGGGGTAIYGPYRYVPL